MRWFALPWIGAVLAIADPAQGAKRYCPVCDGPIEGTVALRRIGNQEVVVHVPCARELDAHPSAVAAKVMPRTALFHERATPVPPLGRLWLYLSIYLLAGLVVGGVAAYVAVDRGRSGKKWFALGLVLNLPAFVALLTRPRLAQPFGAQGLAKVPSTRDPVPCPRCGHLDHPSSQACGACGAPRAPLVESEMAAARRGHG